MKLQNLKDEYIKSIDTEKMESKRDYDQLVNDLEEADDLEEFIHVAGLWANDKDGVGIGKLILQRIVE